MDMLLTVIWATLASSEPRMMPSVSEQGEGTMGAYLRERLDGMWPDEPSCEALSEEACLEVHVIYGEGARVLVAVSRGEELFAERIFDLAGKDEAAAKLAVWLFVRSAIARGYADLRSRRATQEPAPAPEPERREEAKVEVARVRPYALFELGSDLRELQSLGVKAGGEIALGGGVLGAAEFGYVAARAGQQVRMHRVPLQLGLAAKVSEGLELGAVALAELEVAEAASARAMSLGLSLGPSLRASFARARAWTGWLRLLAPVAILRQRYVLDDRRITEGVVSLSLAAGVTF